MQYIVEMLENARAYYFSIPANPYCKNNIKNMQSPQCLLILLILRTAVQCGRCRFYTPAPIPDTPNHSEMVTCSCIVGHHKTKARSFVESRRREVGLRQKSLWMWFDGDYGPNGSRRQFERPVDNRSLMAERSRSREPPDPRSDDVALVDV